MNYNKSINLVNQSFQSFSLIFNVAYHICSSTRGFGSRVNNEAELKSRRIKHLVEVLKNRTFLQRREVTLKVTLHIGGLSDVFTNYDGLIN